MKVPKVAEDWAVATPKTMIDNSSASHAHIYQSINKQTTAQGHCNGIYANPAQIAMMVGEQDAAIREAFTNDDTMPQEAGVHAAIGKNRPSLVHPHE